MNLKIGLIGCGKWGKILHNKLNNISDVKFVCRSKDTYLDKLDDVDWVFIATPDNTHYEIVRNCLSKGKNVFCEKPLTLKYEQSKILYDIAEMNNVKLYVDDIQNYRNYDFEMINENYMSNLVERRKSGGGNIKDILYRLTYHDIYTLYKDIKNLEIESISPIDLKNKLNFNVKFDCGINIEFLYDLNSKDVMHHINGCSLSGDDDILTKMLSSVLNDDVDYDYNKEITLFTNKFIDNINESLFRRIAVVGGGIFGSTTAWMMGEEGYDVDLFEKNDDLITQASYVNQYRLHRGYHYPRSKDTAQSSIWGEESFLREYGKAIVNGDIEHYYCIAKHDSLVTSEQYKLFLDEMNLPYEEKTLDIIQKNVVDLVVRVDEFLFNPDKLKKICWDKLKKYDVDVNLNIKFNVDDLENYDYVINSTYANMNHLLEPSKHKDYQFELCEKPVIKLPEEYKNKSVVIMDGPFMCIDPLGDTDYHVMGNVVHAIHNTNVGKFPVYDSRYDGLLNKGIVKNPQITNIDKFIKSAKKFFVDMDKAKHIGSMFTIRTVLPNRDKDDARPTLVEKPTNKTFNLFSGKIGTCVSSAEEIMEYI
tara:strand:+ start:749 stop:2518 length:1770 start_codon:yes stop_codon:yes gene_type:complete